jgi:hypothetical protein
MVGWQHRREPKIVNAIVELTATILVAMAWYAHVLSKSWND